MDRPAATMWSTQALTVLGGPKLYSGRPRMTASAAFTSSISAALSDEDLRGSRWGTGSAKEVAVGHRPTRMGGAPAIGRAGGRDGG